VASGAALSLRVFSLFPSSLLSSLNLSIVLIPSLLSRAGSGPAHGAPRPAGRGMAPAEARRWVRSGPGGGAAQAARPGHGGGAGVGGRSSAPALEARGHVRRMLRVARRRRHQEVQAPSPPLPWLLLPTGHPDGSTRVACTFCGGRVVRTAGSPSHRPGRARPGRGKPRFFFISRYVG